MNKPGFTILELAIGFMISMILITMAFTIYNSIAKSVERGYQITHGDTHILIAQNRMQTDMYNCMPYFIAKPKKNKQSNEAHAKPEGADSEETKTNTTISNQSTTPEEQSHLLKQTLFFATLSKDTKKPGVMISWLISQGLSSYETPYSEPKRIIYEIQKTSDLYFSLYRKEIPLCEFDPKAWEKIGTKYVVLERILEYEITYEYISEEDDTQTQQQVSTQQGKTNIISAPQKKSKKKIQRVSEKEWNAEPYKKQTSKDKKDPDKPTMPHYIHLRISCAQTEEKKEQYDFTLLIPIEHMLSLPLYKPQEEKPLEQKKKTDEQKETKESLVSDASDKKQINSSSKVTKFSFKTKL